MIQDGKNPRCPIEGLRAAVDEARKGRASVSTEDQVEIFVDEELSLAMWAASGLTSTYD